MQKGRTYDFQYERMAEITEELDAANDQLQAMIQEKLTADSIYRLLLVFDRLYAQTFGCLGLTRATANAIHRRYYPFFYCHFFSGHRNAPFMMNSVFCFTVSHKGSISVLLAPFINFFRAYPDSP